MAGTNPDTGNYHFISKVCQEFAKHTPTNILLFFESYLHRNFGISGALLHVL